MSEKKKKKKKKKKNKIKDRHVTKNKNKTEKEVVELEKVREVLLGALKKEDLDDGTFNLIIVDNESWYWNVLHSCFDVSGVPVPSCWSWICSCFSQEKAAAPDLFILNFLCH